MSAPAINTAPAPVPVTGGASAAAGAASGGATSPGGASDPLAGFEAILTTLFGQGPAATVEPSKVATKAPTTGKSTNGGSSDTTSADAAPSNGATTVGAPTDGAAAQLGQGVNVPVVTPIVVPTTPPDSGTGSGSTGGTLATAGTAPQLLTPADLKLALAGGGPSVAKTGAGSGAEAGTTTAPNLPPAPTSATLTPPPVAPQPTDVPPPATAGQPTGPDIGAQLAALNTVAEQSPAPSTPLQPGAAPPVAIGGAPASKDKASSVKLAAVDPTAPIAIGGASPGTPKIADAVAAIGDPAQKSASDGGGASALPSDPKSDPAPDSGAASADANAATASTTAPSSTTHVAASLVRGSPETVASLAAQILKKLDGRSSRFDVQLDPAGLGRVDVRVEIDSAGRMTAAMAFDNPQAAADVKARSNELQYALEQAGFDVSGGLSFDVSADPGQGGGAQSQSDNSGASFRGRAFQSALNTADDAAQSATASAFNLRQRQSTGVDIRI